MFLLYWFVPYYDGHWNYISLGFWGMFVLGLLWGAFETLITAYRESNDRILKENSKVTNSRKVYIDSTEDVKVIEHKK